MLDGQDPPDGGDSEAPGGPGSSTPNDPSGDGSQGGSADGTSAQPPGSAQARARVLAERGFVAPSAVVDERVAHVRRMMAEGRWFGVSGEELSELWGVSIGAVKRYAAEASRQRRQVIEAHEEQEQYSATMGRLDRLSAAAETVGEFRTAVRAEAEKAKIAGLVRSDMRAVVIVPMGGVELKATVDELRTLLGHVDAFLRERHPSVAAALAAHLVEVKA